MGQRDRNTKSVIQKTVVNSYRGLRETFPIQNTGTTFLPSYVHREIGILINVVIPISTHNSTGIK